MVDKVLGLSVFLTDMGAFIGCQHQARAILAIVEHVRTSMGLRDAHFAQRVPSFNVCPTCLGPLAEEAFLRDDDVGYVTELGALFHLANGNPCQDMEK